MRSRLLVLTLAGVAVAGTAASAATPADTRQVREVQVQRDTSWRGGEPEIAVNPRNGKNMVMVWAAMKNVTTPAGTPYPGLAAQFASPATGMQTIGCQMAYTFDGGRTWYPAPFPLRDKPACGDPMVVADSKGVFHITFDLMGSPFTPSTVGTQPVDQVAASRSTDGGRSWATPVDVGTIVDRPFFRVDASNDRLYEVSGGLLSASSRKLTVSRDAGRTWSAPVAFPADHLAVHRGLLATALQSGNPSRLAFALSRDDGASFSQVVVPRSTAGGTGAWISADPTRAGRFAVMQQVGDVLEVLTTNDAGRTWSAPARLRVPGRTVALPWMDYGPTGVLAVMWKAAASDGTFLVHSAIRRSGATAFSKPLRSSKVASRGGDFLHEGAGDDLSWLTVGRDEVHLAWGDRRTGMLQAWTARVPFAAY
ncbi:MAG: hypothetical protein JWM64_1902 [Frankiales bacterium]|nr:hypothetical protein [Frankiales bacterium]